MKANDLPFPVASIEFEKIYLVMDKRNSLGYSDRELSFLLGYRALYVRNVEDPLHTLRYGVKDANYLLSIFNCKLPEIMPGKIAELFYQIKVITNTNSNGSVSYEIYRELENKRFTLFRSFTTIEKVELTQINSVAGKSEISEFIDNLFKNGYFNLPKTALEVFKHCLETFGYRLQPQFIADALASYTSKRKTPRIVIRKNVSARTVYVTEV